MDPLQFLSNLARTFSTVAPGEKDVPHRSGADHLYRHRRPDHAFERADYRVLFANLSSEDAGSIVDKLKEKKIPYELNGTGDTISVPSEMVAEMRLELAATGLPRGVGSGLKSSIRR